MTFLSSPSGPASTGARPCRTASTFSTARSAIAVRVSVVPLARCGTSRTFSSPSRSGCTTGSCSNTSSAAPAIRCCWSAQASASSSTTGPRAVLIRNADRFMRASARLSIRWRVSFVSGTCSDTISDVFSSRSSDIAFAAVPARPGGSHTRTRMPNAGARAATARAMRPTPTSPSCLPRSSEPSMKSSAHPFHAPRRTSRSPSASRRVMARISAHVKSATDSVSTSGVLRHDDAARRARTPRRCCCSRRRRSR